MASDKRRIVEHNNGTFTVQRLKYWFIWCTETETVGFPLDLEFDIIFNTYDEALEYINKKKNNGYGVKKIYEVEF